MDTFVLIVYLIRLHVSVDLHLCRSFLLYEKALIILLVPPVAFFSPYLPLQALTDTADSYLVPFASLSTNGGLTP